MRILALLIVLLISTFSFADSWDNMTKKEAEAAVAELKLNPYIFDYCDCCDYEGEYAARVFLVKVTSAEITPCEWDERYYSVHLTTTVIAELENTEDGPETLTLLKTDGEQAEQLLAMNYSWGINTETKLATPFFNKVAYTMYSDDRSACKKEFDYPTPKAVKKVSKDKEYAAWYKQRIG